MSNFPDKPEWERSLALESLLIEGRFASTSTAYHESKWADFTARIRCGHDAEMAQAEVRRRDFEKQQEDKKGEPFYDELIDGLADDVFETYRLSNTMFAALIVALWADMESFLKKIICIAQKGIDSGGNVSCKFEEIQKFFKKTFSIDIKTFKNFADIDAIRILNNSFKHSYGYYKPDGRDHTCINQNLLDKWEVMQERGPSTFEIDYSSLPVEELVKAANGFCHELVSSLKCSIRKRNAR